MHNTFESVCRLQVPDLSSYQISEKDLVTDIHSFF